MNKTIREDVGAFARLEGAFIVPRIPKTRSGKLLRRIVKHILNDEPYKMPAAIDDVTSLDFIHTISAKNGFQDQVIKPD